MDIISIYAPAHWDPYDSYGLIACELARHLVRLGVGVNAIALGFPQHENQDKEIKAITKNPVRLATGGILLGYPTSYEAHGSLVSAGPKIAITMFESSKIPEEWVEPLNKCDAIIVPSTFCYRSFIECGVTSSIFVVPLGIGEEYTECERAKDDVFTFLTFADRGRRKGGLDCLFAFAEEFGDDDRVKLIIKRRARKEDDAPEINFVNENIDVIYKDMTSKELADLYRSCHCLVNPNKGEGFGLIPREFAATGGISLVTDWGGTSDLINLWGYPLKAIEEFADWQGHRNLVGKDLGFWAKVPRSIIRKEMRSVFEHRNELQDKFYKNASWVRQIYDWKYFAQIILAVWRNLDGNRSSGEKIEKRRRVRSRG